MCSYTYFNCCIFWENFPFVQSIILVDNDIFSVIQCHFFPTAVINAFQHLDIGTNMRGCPCLCVVGLALLVLMIAIYVLYIYYEWVMTTVWLKQDGLPNEFRTTGGITDVICPCGDWWLRIVIGI